MSAEAGNLEICRLLVESKADVAATAMCFSPPPLSQSFSHYLPGSIGYHGYVIHTALERAIARSKDDVVAYLRSISDPVD